jgi:DNA-binding GntR family transcriptional regulator
VKPDPHDPRPPYVQVADDLRTSIRAGTYKPGERLPSGRELARRYGVAPMTIHHAVGVLRGEQLVESYQGRGVFIADRASARSATLGDWDQDQARQDSEIETLRGDVDRLADRVTWIERLLADGKDPGADAP